MANGILDDKPLEYLSTRVLIQPQYRPTVEEIRDIIATKVDSVPLWSEYTVNQIMDACIDDAHHRGFKRNSPDFGKNMINYGMFRHIRNEPRVGRNIGSMYPSNERIKERSIERIVDIRGQYQLDDLVLTFERTFDVSLARNPLLDFSAVLPQVKLLEHMMHDDHMHYTSLGVLLNVVFGWRGFLSNDDNHLISCLCGEPDLNLKHDCRKTHPNRSRTATAKPHRSDEAEIMYLLLRMRPQDKNWSNTVADYFCDLINDEHRTQFMDYFEWMDAIGDNLFSPELGYSLLYAMTARQGTDLDSDVE
jgi:hypothetical protein